jgi:hypothetical protein
MALGSLTGDINMEGNDRTNTCNTSIRRGQLVGVVSRMATTVGGGVERIEKLQKIEQVL